MVGEGEDEVGEEEDGAGKGAEGFATWGALLEREIGIFIVCVGVLVEELVEGDVKFCFIELVPMGVVEIGKFF